MIDSAGRADLGAPSGVVWIARRLEDAGFPTWVVGGAVRDALAGRDPHDWDLTTAARPRDVQRLFKRTVPIGVAHGTVGVIVKDGRMYEVTTFRRDVETFGRHATVAFADSLEDDLSRRDFTINAVAWHPLEHVVRDPFGGMRDLESGVLRTVGDPSQRFSEDRLRALRALRFAGRFDLRIQDETWDAIVACAHELPALSAERVREELWKILSGVAPPSATLRLYADSGVLRTLYPDLDRMRSQAFEDGGEGVWERSLRAMDAVSRHRPVLRAAALLHAVGVTTSATGGAKSADWGSPGRSAAIARDVMRGLKASNAEIDTITHLIAHQAPVPGPDSGNPEIRRWVRRVGREYINDLFRLLFAIARACESGLGPRANELIRLRARVAEVRGSSVPLDIRELAIDGEDLRGLGIPTGPLYGEILRDLLERVTDESLPNRRDDLLTYVRENTI